jgi:hypothetical protein
MDDLQKTAKQGLQKGLGMGGQAKAAQANPSGAAGGGGIDLEKLAELVAKKLRDELVIENERSGRSM